MNGEVSLMSNSPSNHNSNSSVGLGRAYISRIIQYKGKRSNIRLEALFWEILERMAEEKRCKLNVLVTKLIAEDDSGNNNTAYLRYRAVAWLNGNLFSANERLFLQNTEVRAVLNATGLPAFIFSETNAVSRYNYAFKKWLKINVHGIIKDQELGHLRISFRRSFGAIKTDLEAGKGVLDNEKGAILLPGLVFPVTMNLVALNNYAAEARVFMGIFNLAALTADRRGLTLT